MKKLNFLFAILFLSTPIFAQLKGSGKTVTENYNYKDFDKINFIGFNDDIIIEVGKTFKVEITTKEESKKFLTFEFKASEHELTIKVTNKSKNNNYDERDTYKIKIQMPEISILNNFGNGDININGIVGRSFKAKTTGNGDINCRGSIDELDVEKTGNGDVNAKNLAAKNAKVSSIGNGNVNLNVAEKLTAKNTGNGDVVNYGNAKFDDSSKNIGNGKLLNK